MPEDPAAIFEDPEFMNVAARGDGFEVLRNFMLQKSTPCLGKGISVENDGKKDMFGNKISGKTNIGIHQNN